MLEIATGIIRKKTNKRYRIEKKKQCRKKICLKRTNKKEKNT